MWDSVQRGLLHMLVWHRCPKGVFGLSVAVAPEGLLCSTLKAGIIVQICRTVIFVAESSDVSKEVFQPVRAQCPK